MPSISITWNYKTYRANVTPSTLLSDVLKESCQYFHLGSDVTGYKLVNRNGKAVDLTLPFRFANLAQGANLDLVGLTSSDSTGNNSTKGSSNSTVTKTVNIRISVSTAEGNVTLMGKFPNTSTVIDLLNFVKEKCNLTQYGNDRFSIQIMMKVVGSSDFPKTLLNLGLVEGNHAIRVRVKPEQPATPIQNEVKRIVPEEKKDLKHVEDKPKSKATIKPDIENNVQADKNKTDLQTDSRMEVDDENTTPTPPDLETGKVETNEPPKLKNKVDISYVQSTSNIKEHDDANYEISVQQARAYQKILSKRAADQPMLTKALREKFEAEERAKKEEIKKSIYTGECSIRIKFPDNKVIQITMDNRKTLRDLSEVIINQVLKPGAIPSKYDTEKEIFFQLYIALPYNKIIGKEVDLDKKIDDCEFGNRISLLFKYEPEYSRTLNDGYVRDHLLETNADEGSNSKHTAVAKTSMSTSDNSSTTPPSTGAKRTKFKHAPAWLKLSKKV